MRRGHLLMRSDGEKAQTDRHECVNERTTERRTEEESGRRGEATLAAEWISLISLACGVLAPMPPPTPTCILRGNNWEGGRGSVTARESGEGGGCEAPETTLAHTLLLSPFPWGKIEEIFPRMDYSTRAPRQRPRPQI